VRDECVGKPKDLLLSVNHKAIMLALRSTGTGRVEGEKCVLIREIYHQLLWWEQQLWCCLPSNLISQVVVSWLIFKYHQPVG